MELKNCTQCKGTVEFDQQSNVYICLYCGTKFRPAGPRKNVRPAEDIPALNTSAVKVFLAIAGVLAIIIFARATWIAWDNGSPVQTTATTASTPVSASTPAASANVVEEAPPAVYVPVPPRIFSGSGNDVLTLEPFGAEYVFVITHAGAGNFVVWAHGDRRTLLANTVGDYQGSSRTTSQDTTLLEISARGDWTVEQQPLSSTRTLARGETLTGRGDEVVRILDHGQTAFITYNGTGNFTIWARGSSNNLLANHVGSDSGRAMLRGSYDLIEIRGSGDWTVELE